MKNQISTKIRLRWLLSAMALLFSMPGMTQTVFKTGWYTSTGHQIKQNHIMFAFDFDEYRRWLESTPSTAQPVAASNSVLFRELHLLGGLRLRLTRDQNRVIAEVINDAFTTVYVDTLQIDAQCTNSGIGAGNTTVRGTEEEIRVTGYNSKLKFMECPVGSAVANGYVHLRYPNLGASEPSRSAWPSEVASANNVALEIEHPDDEPTVFRGANGIVVTASVPTTGAVASLSITNEGTEAVELGSEVWLHDSAMPIDVFFKCSNGSIAELRGMPIRRQRLGAGSGVRITTSPLSGCGGGTITGLTTSFAWATSAALGN